MNTQSAAFYLRTAPLIDKLFQLKYKNSEIKTSRQIELGVRKFDKLHDQALDVFDESDQMIPSKDIKKLEEVFETKKLN